MPFCFRQIHAAIASNYGKKLMVRFGAVAKVQLVSNRKTLNLI
jgi:hypothetical protein